MKLLKRIDLTLVYLITATCVLIFQVLRDFLNSDRALSIMALIAFAIFCLIMLIYLYVVYVRKPRRSTSGKWSKEKWIRAGGVIAGAYFLFLVFFPVFSKNEWVYHGLTGLVFLGFGVHAIALKRSGKKTTVGDQHTRP